jgi:hypothetical protein
MRWFVDETAVARRAFPGGNFSSFEVCELISFMDFVIDGYSFVGILYAFFLVIASFSLANSASIPMPDSILGKIGFFLWTCCVLLSNLFVLMSLMSFVTANASASALYADCLTEGTTDFKLFNLFGIFSGAFHPFVISCLCLMNMYTVLLLLAYRVWKARLGKDAIFSREVFDRRLPGFLNAFFYALWPLFNVFIWVFSLSFIFSLCFLPSFLLLTGIMYVSVVLLGKLHPSQIHNSLKEQEEDSGGYIEDKMESWVRWVFKPVVEVVYNVTAPYQYFAYFGYGVLNGSPAVSPEGSSCMAFILSVRATLVLFALSTLVTSGTQLALHVYSGHNGSELIDELYSFQYDAFTHTPRFNMRIFDLDFAKALESLPTSFSVGSLPDVGWGPENFAQLARSQNTLTLLCSFIRCAIAVIFFALEAFGAVNSSVGVAEAGGGGEMRERTANQNIIREQAAKIKELEAAVKEAATAVGTNDQPVVGEAAGDDASEGTGACNDEGVAAEVLGGKRVVI